MNHFGHSISYNELNALETKLAKEQVNYQTNTFLLTSSQAYLIFSFDNCVHDMESMYNATLHGKNGVIVQQLDKQQIEVTRNSSTIVSTERRKSFKPIYQELQSYIKEKERKNPIPIKQVDTNIKQLDGSLSRQEGLLWLLLQYCKKDNQVMRGWKGFFYAITKEITDTHIVGYLPTICQSPTKMDVPLEVLKQRNQKAEALNINETDLVLDHATYAKVVEIVMNEKFTDLRTFMNIRMGGIHAASTFLGLIGKRFQDAGLQNLIIKSRLQGVDQVDHMPKGKGYNSGMRIHFHIAEAILRKKFEAFEECLLSNNKYSDYNGALESAESEGSRSSQRPETIKEGFCEYKNNFSTKRSFPIDQKQYYG